MPSRCSMIHAPRSTGDVRSGYDVASSTLPLPNRPKRCGSVSSTRRNWSPRTPADAVVTREPLVHERVLRVEQIRARCACRRAGCCRGNDPSRPRTRLRRSSSKFGYSRGSGSMASSPRTPSHWNAKFVTSERERGSASMRASCPALEHGGLVQALPSSASASSSSSGPWLHRKNASRDASSRSLIAYAAPGLRDPRAAHRAPRGTGTSCSRGSPSGPSGCRCRSRAPRGPARRTRAAARFRSRSIGRRNAPRASRASGSARAHGSSSAAVFRVAAEDSRAALGRLAMPVGSNGPMISMPSIAGTSGTPSPGTSDCSE